MRGSTSTARCACGRCEVVLDGDPIACVICHCDACQEGGRRIEAGAGAPRVLDARGTAYVLYRADRVSVVRGDELVRDQKLTAQSATSRAVATCCGVPVLVRFDRGPHWINIYRERLATARAPEMRIQTKHVPAGLSVPPGPPAHRGFPVALLARLVVARLAMVASRVRRPRAARRQG